MVKLEQPLVAFFLVPKSEVIYENENSTMRQALERMEYHRYTAIPILDDSGHYVSTITEGDLLWKIKNDQLSFQDTNNIKLREVPKNMMNKTVSINASIEELVLLAARQNFVPVIDDQQYFIGIVKRGDIINYCYNKLFKV
ncbi:CBS domain-containing protein [Natranaerobius thermophilus]|uniref:CBS domain containing membrane protein n=1 Tax=Natranaerobius thermophilus (strain ATCC BAA-1301 / DSM 18059 / JW/NM-WN-LF) TaxID=457570 RepID=B2A0H2_NATTJ|nr:CBS domain-containing protein [Natranaerobius thermophilus]ACB84533.1 CBS domain containing membrane protein [Natranaerobius thermophilus JW/NM-WN-LF]